VLTGPNVILTLKIAVLAVTAILIASLVALARGNQRLHGRLNVVFFTLTVAAVLGLELLVRVVQPDVFDYFDDATRQALTVHLWFSLPATLLLPLMLWSGLSHRGTLHLILASVFAVLWIGTVVTGVFFLPHAAP
jgi:uncharacterized membrane protein YozB (DUF420 family)